MLLSTKQIESVRAELKRQGVPLRIQTELGDAYGKISGNIFNIKMMLVNTIDSTHTYKDKTGTTHKSQHDPRKTLAHEYTHILQVRKGFYFTSRSSNEKELYNYNEIVANTIGMLCYPTQANIIDNADYVNKYLSKGVGSLIKHLKDDIRVMLPEVKQFLKTTGLL